MLQHTQSLRKIKPQS